VVGGAAGNWQHGGVGFDSRGLSASHRRAGRQGTCGSALSVPCRAPPILWLFPLPSGPTTHCAFVTGWTGGWMREPTNVLRLISSKSKKVLRLQLSILLPRKRSIDILKNKCPPILLRRTRLSIRYGATRIYFVYYYETIFLCRVYFLFPK
jgi:hypothetical protein